MNTHKPVTNPSAGPPPSADKAQQADLTADQLANALEALRLSEQRHAFGLQLSDTLRALADPQLMLDEAARRLGEFLGANRVGYAETQADTQLVAVTRNFTQGVPSLEGIYRYQDYGPDLLRSMQRGQTVIRPDIAKDPTLSKAEKQAHALLQLGASLNVPLVRQGRLVAILFVHYRQAHVFAPDEVAFAQETAERTWAYLEQARSEAALRESQQQLSAIVNQATAGIARTDPDGRFTFINEQYARQLGYESGELLGHKMQEFTHPDDLARNLALFQRLGQYGESFDIEKRYIRNDRSVMWVHNQVSAVRNAAGEITQLMAVSVDITARKQAQEALQQADRRKDEFLAMLAHELRNPLATIRSGLQLLSITEGNDETTGPTVGSATIAASTVAMMNRQSNQLVHLVDDLLDVSRIRQGKIDLHQERVNLVDLVQQTAASHQATFQEQDKRLHLKLPRTAIELNGDATRLSQIVTNLLTNSLRYTGEHGQVWLSLEQKAGPSGGQEAILAVRDNGLGLAADQLSAIFELFVQVDNSTARSKGGLGLGLTLVKRLVELHGGHVGAQSDGIGLGSTFTVHLPTLTFAAEPTAQVAPQASDSPTTRRILVIDDNDDAGFMLGRLLTLKGYEAHTRTTGRSGLEAAENLQPSAILLDIGMPDLDGYATCRLIRAQRWGQAMALIALTGYGQEEDRQRSREAGFDGHLVKPVDLGELIKMLTDLLDKGQNNARLE